MKIAVLVSGGVDSSVALWELKKQGHELTAFYLKIWLEDELGYLGSCPWEDDLQYVRQVCEQAEVPLQIISLQREYHDQVVQYVITEVKAGRTPNPDILCNSRIKFGMFINAINNSYDKVATGHYAQLRDNNNGYVELLRSPDPIKDQSYFLSQLTQQQLSRALFPIGHLYKWQVRALAEQLNLPNKIRKDSQGICFLGKLKFKDFIAHYLGELKGQLREYETGHVLGIHEGYWFYTIGQRQGIGLSQGPWYVVAKDIERNIVYISRNYYTLEKKRNIFNISSCNWISRVPVNEDVWVKMRHGAHMHEASIRLNDEGKRYTITLAEQDQGIASGQFAVVYDGEVCLGGGIIEMSNI